MARKFEKPVYEIAKLISKLHIYIPESISNREPTVFFCNIFLNQGINLIKSAIQGNIIQTFLKEHEFFSSLL